jgi:hypothetical protein
MTGKLSNLPKDLKLRVKAASKGKLSTAQSHKLRIDLNKWIEKNKSKQSISAASGSKMLGERQTVVKESARFKKIGKKVSIDPETKLWIDVIDIALKKAKGKPGISLLKKLKAWPKQKLQQLVRNFKKGDMVKVRRFKKQLKKADYLTSGNYMDFIEFNKKMFSIKKAVKRSAKKASKTAVRRRKRIPVRRRTSIKEKLTEVQAGIKRRKRAAAKRRTKPRGKIRARPRTKTRVTKRAVPRRPKARPRTIKRVVPRKRSRTSSRPRPRVVVRPRVKPRVKPRPRPRPRVVIRPRPIPKRPPIPVWLKFKPKNKKQKEDLEEWLMKQPRRYRPSLAAVLFNITGYKIPKRITGFEIRPMLVRKKPIKRKVVKRKRRTTNKRKKHKRKST